MVGVIDNGNTSVLTQTFNYQNKNFAANRFLEQIFRTNGPKTFQTNEKSLNADKLYSFQVLISIHFPGY